MAFNSNANNSNLHTCSSTNSGPKRLSFLDVVLNKKEDSNSQADRGGFDRTVGSPSSLRARSDFGNRGRSHVDNPCHIHKYGDSASPSTSYATPTMWRDDPRQPQNYQPTTTSHSTQRYCPATLDRVSSTVAQGMRDPICGKHACSESFLGNGYSPSKTARTNYWEGDRSGPSASTVYTVSRCPNHSDTPSPIHLCRTHRLHTDRVLV